MDITDGSGCVRCVRSNSASSAELISCVDAGSPVLYKPSRTPRRTNVSVRCLSGAVVNPHHAGNACFD